MCCPDHIPLTVIVKPGILDITEAGGDKDGSPCTPVLLKFFPTGVTILAEVIEWPE